MSTQYRCNNQTRRDLVRAPRAHDGTPLTPTINGIDFLEVGPDQKTLTVVLIHNLPGTPTDPVPPAPAPALTPNNVQIEGGVRITNVLVTAVSADADVLTVTVDQPGDFSTYTLRLVQGPNNAAPPGGFDPQLSAIEFSFKVDCPSEFDCAPDQECPTEPPPEPEIDYLAKDYTSFRRLMLDRMSVLLPQWQERNAADMHVALVELLAYAGDHLSYFQDAVATEAYLGTARRRTSIRRHARLLDYVMHDGCNARAWVYFEVHAGGDADGENLETGRVLLTRGADDNPIVAPTKLQETLAERPLVFETRTAVRLSAAHNEINFYTWDDTGCCLPRGATCATLRDKPETPLQLQVGDFLLFEEIKSPTTGAEADADPSHRHVVRLTQVQPTADILHNTAIVEIAWSQADALPFPLCISAEVSDRSGNRLIPDVSVARGNIALADHGRTITDEALVPDRAPQQTPYRPRLARGGLTYEGPLDLGSASAALRWDVRKARPRVRLRGEDRPWLPQFDLLGSDSFRTEFVVEMESDGLAHLRFGDGVLGRAPAPGASFTATYRIGNGTAGNVGSSAIGRIVKTGSGIASVRNPLPAVGGTDPELLEQVRLYAPQAFRTQERAVTEADYAEVARRHPDVQQAVARIRWTGSWYTVFVTIDRKGGQPVDPAFKDEIRAHLERYRIAGYDLEIASPLFVPLDLLLSVCVKPGYFRSSVKEALLIALSSTTAPGGQRGFFHPDNFTFGQAVYLSQIYEAAMRVTGVASVDVLRFQRWGKTANQEIENGVLALGPIEVARLDNDPNFPENGKLEIQTGGGL
ncbi:MAG TPA: putative baseplate assembly protein [Herpetosiphonaceae bacterium]